MLPNEFEYFGLHPVLLAGVLAYINELRIGASQGQNLARYQAIVQEDITLPQNAGRFQRQKFRIARTAADQV